MSTAAAGVGHYWVIAPSPTAYGLDAEDAHREEAYAAGDERWTTTTPVH